MEKPERYLTFRKTLHSRKTEVHLWQSLFNTDNEVFFEAPVTRVRVPPPKKKPILWMWVALGLLARTVLKMLGLDSLWEKATQSNDGDHVTFTKRQAVWRFVLVLKWRKCSGSSDILATLTCMKSYHRIH
jgi:hypothetical protein